MGSVRRGLFLVAGLFLSTIVDCGGGSGKPQPACDPGTERCACYGNGTCNAGLACLSNRCVVTAPADGGAVGGTGGGSGGLTATGGNRLTPAGVLTEFPLVTDQAGPGWGAVGADGNIWFTEGSANKIARITP